MDFKAYGLFLTPLGATPGGLKLPLRAFEPQMSPPYDFTHPDAFIDIFNISYGKTMFSWLKGGHFDHP